MPKKEVNWSKIKREYVDGWEPPEKDADWLIAVISKLKVGGKWLMPGCGITFEKVAEDHLKLESIKTNDLIGALVTVLRTKKVGERAAIKVDIENTANLLGVNCPEDKYWA